MISQSRFLISQNFCDFLYHKIDFVKSKSRICHVKKSILWYKKLILWYQIIAPINNLINAHALNFVSAGIGNTPAFFFFFLQGSHYFISWKFYIFWYHKSDFVNPPEFSIPRNQFYDIKISNLWHQKIDFLQNHRDFFWYHKMLYHKIDFVI